MKQIITALFMVFALYSSAQTPEIIQTKVINSNCRVTYAKVQIAPDSVQYVVDLAFISTRNLWYHLILDDETKFYRFKNDLINKTLETTLTDKSQYNSVVRKEYYIGKHLDDDNIHILLTNNQERWILTKEVAKELSLFINNIPYGKQL